MSPILTGLPPKGHVHSHEAVIKLDKKNSQTACSVHAHDARSRGLVAPSSQIPVVHVREMQD